MGSISNIDKHPKRKKIIAEIVRGKASHRQIAEKYGLSNTAVFRYLKEKLPESAAQAILAESKAAGQVVLEEMASIMTNMRKMQDACDEWLTDPANPEKYYLGPRGEEMMVTYDVITKKKTKSGIQEIKTRKKETLQAAMDRLSKNHREVINIQYKHYDIRKLIIDNADTITKQLNLMAEIQGAIPDIKVNITISEAWMYLKHIVVDATQGYPEVRSKILEGIKKSNIER